MAFPGSFVPQLFQEDMQAVRLFSGYLKHCIKKRDDLGFAPASANAIAMPDRPVF